MTDAMNEDELVAKAYPLLWASGLPHSFLQRQLHRWRQKMVTDEEFLASFTKVYPGPQEFVYVRHKVHPVTTVKVRKDYL